MGLIGPYGKERSRPQGLLRPSPCWSELDKGLGGATPLFPSPSSPLPSPLGGLLLGVGLASSSSLLYIRRRGTPWRQLSHSRVRCPDLRFPPRSYFRRA